MKIKFVSRVSIVQSHCIRLWCRRLQNSKLIIQQQQTVHCLLSEEGVQEIMAVLEKRAGLLLQNQDAYLKSAGGVKLDEPAIDLAVAVAIASSYKDKPTNPQECFVGELGLTGEIRRVNRIEQRINEAAKLGFTKIYVPKNSLTGITPPKEIEVIGVTTIQEVLKKVFA